MAQVLDRQALPGVSKAAAYYMAFIGLGLASAAVGPVLPRLAQQVAVGVSAVSIIFTARSTGYLLGSLVAGRTYDRLPAHAVMAGGLALMAAAMLLIPAMPSLALLVLLGLVLGLGEGLVDVGGNASMVWVFAARVAPYMNALHFFFGFGAFVSPLLVAQAILITQGHAWAFRLIALLLVPAAAFLLAQPSPVPHRPPADGVTGRAELSLLGLIVLFLLVYVGAEVSYGGWVFTYATSTGLAPEATAAYLTSVFWGALTAGRLLSIPLAMRFSARTMLGGSVLGGVLGIGLVNLLPGSVAALWVGTFVVGLSMATIFPTVITLAGTLMTVTGRVTGWFLIGASAGAMLVPWFVGQLLGLFGPLAVMRAIMVNLIVLALLFVVLMRRVPRTSS